MGTQLMLEPLKLVEITATNGKVYGLDEDGKVWVWNTKLAVKESCWTPIPMFYDGVPKR